MKFWLLRPREDLPTDNNPWEPWYDKAFGFVARAETEEEARRLATSEQGDEVEDRWVGTRRIPPKRNPWIDPAFSTCSELVSEGEQGVIMRDFASA